MKNDVKFICHVRGTKKTSPLRSLIRNYCCSTKRARKNSKLYRYRTPGGVLPYMGYIGMCGHKGYGFSAVLVINRVSIIAILPPLWS